MAVFRRQIRKSLCDSVGISRHTGIESWVVFRWLGVAIDGRVIWKEGGGSQVDVLRVARHQAEMYVRMLQESGNDSTVAWDMTGGLPEESATRQSYSADIRSVCVKEYPKGEFNLGNDWRNRNPTHFHTCCSAFAWGGKNVYGQVVRGVRGDLGTPRHAADVRRAHY